MMLAASSVSFITNVEVFTGTFNCCFRRKAFWTIGLGGIVTMTPVRLLLPLLGTLVPVRGGTTGIASFSQSFRRITFSFLLLLLPMAMETKTEAIMIIISQNNLIRFKHENLRRYDYTRVPLGAHSIICRRICGATSSIWRSNWPTSTLVVIAPTITPGLYSIANPSCSLAELNGQGRRDIGIQHYKLLRE